jgi:hypothetical protein
MRWPLPDPDSEFHTEGKRQTADSADFAGYRRRADGFCQLRFCSGCILAADNAKLLNLIICEICGICGLRLTFGFWVDAGCGFGLCSAESGSNRDLLYAKTPDGWLVFWRRHGVLACRRTGWRRERLGLAGGENTLNSTEK